MARIRSIKPEFWTNSTTGRLSGIATKLYLGLQNHCDDYGVIRDDPTEFGAKILPYERGSNSVERALDELNMADADQNPYGLIVRFQVGRKRYIWLPYFLKHQKVNRPGDPIIDGWNPLSTPLDYADSLNAHDSFSERSVNDHNLDRGDRSGEERIGKEISVVDQDRPRTDIDKVWEPYAAHHPRARPTPDRRRRIQRWLRHYPAETLISAIEGNHLDPHCNGQNDRGTEYHDLELILRDAAHIERYAALHQATTRNGKPTREEMDELIRQVEERQRGYAA